MSSDESAATPGEKRPRWAGDFALCDICDEYASTNTCRICTAHAPVSERTQFLVLCNKCYQAAFKTAYENNLDVRDIEAVERVARAMFELKLEERGLT